MISTLDIIRALARECNKIIPNATLYIGQLPENTEYPALLFEPSFTKELRSNYFTKSTSLAIDVIYFNNTKDSYTDKLEKLISLQDFLDTYNLTVKDRNLKFDYESNVDDWQLIITLVFKFTDNAVVDTGNYDLMKEINLNLN